MDPSPELRLLFHRLNNQLGIILAHAELLEAKSGDEMNRSRAAQVVAGALDAMSTATEIRRCTMKDIDYEHAEQTAHAFQGRHRRHHG